MKRIIKTKRNNWLSSRFKAIKNQPLLSLRGRALRFSRRVRPKQSNVGDCLQTLWPVSSVASLAMTTISIIDYVVLFFYKKLSYKFLTLFLIGFFSLSAAAQVQPKLHTTDKKAIKFFKTGDNLLYQGNYQGAIANLKKAIEKDGNFLEARMELGVVYSHLKKDSLAIADLEKVIAINPAIYPAVHYELGKMYLRGGQYEKARAAFHTFLKYNSDIKGMAADAKLQIENCDFAEYAVKHPVPFQPINMGSGVNSKYPEYFPCLTADDQTLLFTRRLPDKHTASGFNEDFFVSYKNADGTWGKAIHLGPPINTLSNEGAPTLSADGQTLIFTACEMYGSYGPHRQGVGSCDLFFTQLKGNQWTPPLNLGQGVNTRNWESQPSFSSDGKTLYFIRGTYQSDGTKNYDIWVSEIQSNGAFGTAHRLSKVINSPGKEESVFIHPDGKTLYFASDGHPGMGGTDLFVSRKDSNGNWTTPVNLGYPINTSDDENSILVAPDGKVALFASDRPGGLGGLDMYAFKLPQKDRATPVTYLKGHVFDAETKKPLKAYFTLKDLSTGKTVVQSTSNPLNGYFLVTLPKGREYALNVSKKGYLFYSDNFILNQPDSVLKAYKKDIPLKPIKTGQSIVLKNVFFETAKYDLKPKSKVELDKLVDFMQTNANISVELDGYTDNVGKDADNLTLSKNRAKAVYDYLIAHGIVQNRLSYKGFGETNPVATNDTPAGRQLNRRTEYKITAVK